MVEETGLVRLDKTCYLRVYSAHVTELILPPQTPTESIVRCLAVLFYHDGLGRVSRQSLRCCTPSSTRQSNELVCAFLLDCR